MTVQTVPFALQNASHSAALFRQSASAPFISGGILAAGELTITQQATPNMSVVLGAGRAKVPGTSVSPPSGLSFTTQGMYDVLNDAPLTLTVAAADATNPRIDVPYVQVQDSFYSGAANQAIAGIVTGTPAPTPTTPPVPSNAIGLNPIAVAANATSIFSANIGPTASLAVVIGGLRSFASAALRDAAIPSPTNGLQISRSDTGWIEQYYGTLAVAPGWYPIYGRLPFTRLALSGSLASGGLTVIGATAPLWVPATFSAGVSPAGDTPGWHSASNPERVIPTLPGLYRIEVATEWASNATGYRAVELRKNNVRIPGSVSEQTTVANQWGASNVVREVWLNGTTDYLSVAANQASGSALAISSEFNVQYVGPE